MHSPIVTFLIVALFFIVDVSSTASAPIPTDNQDKRFDYNGYHKRTESSLESVPSADGANSNAADPLVDAETNLLKALSSLAYYDDLRNAKYTEKRRNKFEIRSLRPLLRRVGYGPNSSITQRDL